MQHWLNFTRSPALTPAALSSQTLHDELIAHGGAAGLSSRRMTPSSKANRRSSWSHAPIDKKSCCSKGASSMEHQLQPPAVVALVTLSPKSPAREEASPRARRSLPRPPPPGPLPMRAFPTFSDAKPMHAAFSRQRRPALLPMRAKCLIGLSASSATSRGELLATRHSKILATSFWLVAHASTSGLG